MVRNKTSKVGGGGCIASFKIKSYTDVLVLDSALNLFKSLLKVYNLLVKFNPCSGIPLLPPPL